MWDWQGKELKAKVLYSAKGLATQILISGEADYFLLDCGDGTTRDLSSTGLPWVDKLLAILITHDHPDHTGGIFSVLTFLRLRGRKRELFILTPDGNFAERVRFYRDLIFGGFPFEVEVKVVEEHLRFRFQDLVVQPFKAIHREKTESLGTGGFKKAVGYLLCGKSGEKIAYTGDTGWYPGIDCYFKGVDLALIEATFDFPKGSERHLTVEQARDLGKLSKRAILIHR